jgi:hypothetical protein
VSLHNNIARVYEFDGHLMYEESVSVFLDNYKLLSQLSFDGEFE